jgi:hypothetical protein
LHFSRNPELADETAPLVRGLFHVFILRREEINDSRFLVQNINAVLVVLGYFQTSVSAHRAFRGLNITRHEFQQSALPGAVRAD